jgi:two-component system sensor histidine kinase BaeS
MPAEEEKVAALLRLIAHDLRAPLGVLTNAMSELTHPTVGQLNDEQRALVGLMKRSAERLSGLASNLSQLSQISVGRIELAPDRVDLRALARDAVRRAREVEDIRALEVRVEAEGEPLLAEVDASKIALALSNLLSNALRFARRSVVVRVGWEGPLAMLAVEDDGSGVTEEQLATIFDRVEAAVLSRGKSGSGLGLAVVRGIARAHGGEARAENIVIDGKITGARFSVILPRVCPDLRG